MPLITFLIWFFLNNPAKIVLQNQELQFPMDFLIDGNRLFVVDFDGHAVFSFDHRGGSLIKKIGSPGQGPGELIHPEKIWRDGDRLLVFSHENRTITLFDLTGRFKKTVPVPAGGFVEGSFHGSMVMVGHSPGPFSAKTKMVRLVDGETGSVRKAWLAPSPNSIRAKGQLQSYLFVLDADAGECFYGDPLDFNYIHRLSLDDGRERSLPIALELERWDGKGQLTRETVFALDRYHCAGNFLVTHDGAKYLFATWLRAGTGLPAYVTQVFDLSKGVPVASFHVESRGKRPERRPKIPGLDAKVG